MSKRAADRQITQDTLDNEEEAEDVRLLGALVVCVVVTVISLDVHV